MGGKGRGGYIWEGREEVGQVTGRMQLVNRQEVM